VKILDRVKEVASRRRDLGARLRGSGLSKGDCDDLLFLLRVNGWLARALERKIVAVERLRRCFVKRTESSKKILKDIERSAEGADPSAGTTDAPPAPPPAGSPRKGHGRIGAKGYSNTEGKRIPHESLRPGMACSKCPGGKVYWHPPGTFLKLIGGPVIRAALYLQEKYRCNACGAIFAARIPPGIGDSPTATPEASAMVALLRYGAGMPNHRMAKLQSWLGVPLPASTQWDMILALYRNARAIGSLLWRLGAQGSVIHQDDTSARVLELMKEIEVESRARDEAKARGETPPPAKDDAHAKIYTTGLLSRIDGHSIQLYVTSRRHAGDNLDRLLREREPARPPPIQMGDMLSANDIKAECLRAACMDHNRRGFIDCYSVFPDPVRYVIRRLKVVYRAEAKAKALGMTPEERLLHHQQKSAPVMDELRVWGKRQIEERLVEPNGPLGKAIAYMLRHYDALTLFLRVPEAPLANDALERLFKMAKSHLKNSLFYKTRGGAEVGDLMMSLIQTCVLNGENPLDYLVAIQKHERKVSQSPEKWLPWNWRENLDAAAPKIAA
jgi:hypothetical protein